MYDGATYMKESFIESVVNFLISYQESVLELLQTSKENPKGLAGLIETGKVFDFAERLESYFFQFFSILPGAERARIEKNTGKQLLNSDLLTIETVSATIINSIEEISKIPVSEETLKTTNALPLFFRSAFLLSDLMARFESKVNPNAFMERLRISQDQDPTIELTRISRYLQNHVLLMIGEQPYRITEIEAYYHSNNHPDPYVHRATEQARCGYWYFHKRGSGYREGKIKGLDIAIGTEGRIFGGILIRGIAPQNQSGEYIDGPSRVVDEILKNLNSTKVRDIAGKLDQPITKEKSPELYLTSNPSLMPGEWCAAPRVGLGLRNDNDLALQKTFFLKRYRFHICPDQTSVDRGMIFLSLVLQGWNAGMARLLMNMSDSMCMKSIEAFKQGFDKDLSGYLRPKLTASEHFELYGALSSPGIRALITNADLAVDGSKHPHFDE